MKKVLVQKILKKRRLTLPKQKQNWKKPRLNLRRTEINAWLYWLKWQLGRKLMQATRIGKSKRVNCINSQKDGATAVT